jgi:DNA-binding XRE family transcriptional regulator
MIPLHGVVTMILTWHAVYSDRMGNVRGRPCRDCGVPLLHCGCTDIGDRGPWATPHLVLPAGFYDDPGLSAALARFEFGPVFRRVRVEQGWSQHVLGALLGFDQATIANIENGKQSLTDAATVIRCANLLAIPAGKFGLRHGLSRGPVR